MTPPRLIGLLLLIGQAVLGTRVALRLARTANGSRIVAISDVDPGESCTVLIPVLNEAARLEPCLAGIAASGPVVAEILVIDGGSTDGTQALIADWAKRDSRIGLIDASPVPADWNGKAWGLHVGLEQSSPASPGS